MKPTLDDLTRSIAEIEVRIADDATANDRASLALMLDMLRARMLSERGDHDGAYAMALSAADRHAAAGVESYESVWFLALAAAVALRADRNREAREHATVALEVADRTLTPSDPLRRDALETLAHAALRLGDVACAVGAFDRLVKLHALQSPRSRAALLDRIARDLFGAAAPGAALEHARAAADLLEGCSGPSDRDAVRARVLVAQCLSALGSSDEAERVLAAAIRSVLSAPADSSPEDLAYPLEALALHFADRDQIAMAEQMMRRARSMRSADRTRRPEARAATLYNVALVLARKAELTSDGEDRAAAALAFAEALEIYAEVPGADAGRAAALHALALVDGEGAASATARAVAASATPAEAARTAAGFLRALLATK